ncbi:hypothetical protein [uncultured Sphingomonas sp.]
MHKQQWNQRAAELHAEADTSRGDASEQVRQSLRDHYADRFRSETSRAAF